VLATWLAVEWVGLVAFVLVVGGGSEAFRASSRRRLVAQWAEDQGFTLVEARYDFRLLGYSSLVHYRVWLRDGQGREIAGVVSSTGFLRRKVRVEDWGAPGRWFTPSP
jgi:hypothetical protein